MGTGGLWQGAVDLKWLTSRNLNIHRVYGYALETKTNQGCSTYNCWKNNCQKMINNLLLWLRAIIIYLFDIK